MSMKTLRGVLAALRRGARKVGLAAILIFGSASVTSAQELTLEGRIHRLREHVAENGGLLPELGVSNPDREVSSPWGDWINWNRWNRWTDWGRHWTDWIRW